MKTKLKPRRLWANVYPDGSVDAFVKKQDAKKNANLQSYAAIAAPVAVIPLDDVDGLVAAACNAHSAIESDNKQFLKPVTHGDCMRAALAAIGVLPKRKKGGRK